MSMRSCILNIVFIFAAVNLQPSCAGNTAKEAQTTDEKANSNANFSEVNFQIEEGVKILARLNEMMPTKPEKALSIGKEHLSIPGQNLADLKLCDSGLGWRVIDVSGTREIWIAKNNGEVYTRPFSISGNVFDESPTGPIDQAKAVQKVQEHFDKFSRERFNAPSEISTTHFPSVCDLGTQWRIYFISKELAQIDKPNDIKKVSNDHPPDYAVAKNSGEIIYFNYFQKM